MSINYRLTHGKQKNKCKHYLFQLITWNQTEMSNEKENFYRFSTLIVDDAKDSFIGLLDSYLTGEGISFQEFLERHAHELYHLCYNNQPCCLCPPNVRKPINGPPSRILHPAQLDLLFNTTSVTRLPGHNRKSRSKQCCFPININFKKEDLDLTITKCLLVNFTTSIPEGSTERNAVEELANLRNIAYGHAKRGAIPQQDYDKYLKQIKKCLLNIGRKCKNEDEVKQKLKDAQARPLDNTICNQFQTHLLMLMERNEDLRTVNNDFYSIVL